MRITAAIFSAIAVYALLRLENLAYHFVPMQVSGAEGGMIEAALDMMFGSIAALIAFVFAILHFRKARQTKGAKWLLGWCGLLTLAFLAVFIGDIFDYSKVSGR